MSKSVRSRAASPRAHGRNASRPKKKRCKVCRNADALPAVGFQRSPYRGWVHEGFCAMVDTWKHKG
jgi:hypothetical protein